MLSVLLVEDSRTQLRLIEAELKGVGYAVVAVDNPVTALERLTSAKIDIIVTDIVMPGMNGYELCRRVKQDPSRTGIPIMLLTMLSDPAELINALEAGADGFMTKPCTGEVLRRGIEGVMANRHLGQAADGARSLRVVVEGREFTLGGHAASANKLGLLLSTYVNAIHRNKELARVNMDLQVSLATIRRMHQSYRSVLENSSDGIVVCDPAGLVLFMNPAAAQHLGVDAAAAVGQPLLVETHTGRTEEVEVTRPGEKAVVLEVRSAETVWEGKAAVLSTIRDVTERTRLQRELGDMAFKDELTEVYNRRGFMRLATQELSRAAHNLQKATLFYCDVDELKWINDNLGHEAGDLAIAQTARVLRSTFRQSDVVARMGGDEFAVLAVGAGENEARVLFDRMQSAVDALNQDPDRLIPLSVSVGWVSRALDDRRPVEVLMQEADSLMYEVKRARKASRPRR